MPKRRQWPAVLKAELSAFVACLKAEYGLDRADIIAELRSPTPEPTPRQRKRLHQGDPLLVCRMIKKMDAGQSFTSASESVADEEGLDVANTSRRLRNIFNREYRRSDLFRVIVVKTMRIDNENDVREIQQTEETEEFFYLRAGETVLATEAKPVFRETIRTKIADKKRWILS